MIWFNNLREQLWVRRLVPWVVLFMGLVGAFYAATQNSAAPYIILLAFLYVLVITFGQPVPHGRVGLTPMLALASLLMLGAVPAFMALASGLLLAELTRPIWRTVGQMAHPTEINLATRLGQAAVQAAALAASYGVYTAVGGHAPLQPQEINIFNSAPLLPIIWLGLAHFAVVLLLNLVLNWGHGRTLRQFGVENLPALAAFGLLSQPFALLWALSFISIGLPALVIFGAGLAGFALAFWNSWQNRALLGQQVAQFAQLNQVGQSLRETLDLPTVLVRTWEQVNELIPADSFTIALLGGTAVWEQAFVVDVPHGRHQQITQYQPDDLTRWVAEHGRVLELDGQNQHYASQHQLTLPQPAPEVWLGVPLITSEQTIGVLVIQRYAPALPLSRWSRELLLAIGQQASSAIQNARLHGETVRLYNLTDEALARRVEQLQALLNSIHEGVLMLDRAGRVAQVNPLAAAWLAAPAVGELLEDYPTAVARLGYEPAMLSERLQQVETLPRAPQSTIYALPVENGRLFIERTEVTVVAGDGRVMGWLMVLRDVTAQEEQAQWRTQFTHMIVHDLRNPISTLMSNMHLLEEQLTDPAPRQLVQTSQQVSHHMLDMVDSLMDINQMEAGQFMAEVEAMRLPPLAERLLTALAPLASRKRITLQLTVADGLPAVWADEELVRRILVNLLDNALKFTPVDGRIALTLTAEPAADPAQSEQGVRCVIVDNGPGIPMAHKEHIFERFVRIGAGGAQVRGTGVGLYFCKLAVAAQDGRIWVEDAAEGGSAFVLTLPGIPIPSYSL